MNTLPRPIEYFEILNKLQNSDQYIEQIAAVESNLILSGHENAVTQFEKDVRKLDRLDLKKTYEDHLKNIKRVLNGCLTKLEIPEPTIRFLINFISQEHGKLVNTIMDTHQQCLTLLDENAKLKSGK